ncbi:hypothetical protein [Bacteroidetes bacterium endosymbiont of Geopemphigus sp.]|uniref:hypothetical protein n=1 Tax=Bacteroidetes bacterium endosymbiont of Geopemphigus sp. TaxID=2047937 RepID=UPI0022441C08|nr:hypothetical protein [Bacteroidetes bacterium endosymbiont of Geopemphigus sp.]
MARYRFIDLAISFSAIVLAGFLFAVLLFMILFFVSVAFALWISHYYNSYTLGFGIVALFYTIIVIVFFASHTYWFNGFLKNFLTRMVSKNLNFGKEK